jgi:hypothetical protein
MTKNSFLFVGLLAGTLVSVLAAGCMTTGTIQSSGSTRYQTGQPQLFQDDYDYYPGYEVYYSRNRHEYVYREGNAWVRRPAPRGITASVLLTMPSVRVDFHDSPDRHHASVVQSYPKNWKQPGPTPRNNDHRDDQATGKQNENRKDKDQGKDEHRKDDDRQN